jgi:hypothetical protein
LAKSSTPNPPPKPTKARGDRPISFACFVIRMASVVATATISTKSGFLAFTLVMTGLKSSVFTG